MSSINPINEDIVEYINHFIREEKEKGIAGDKNEEIIHRLESLITEYRAAFDLINSNVINETDRSYTPTIDEIFTCKLQLFELPITGKYIEDQVESLNSNQ
ncbi:unnamed protein product, partial [Rotaria magnacalcarata]